MLTFTAAIEEINELVGKDADGGDKSTKAEADYQSVPNGDQQCADCSMYVVPSGCTSVAGYIAPHGWCKFYERKKRNGVAKSFNEIMKEQAGHPFRGNQYVQGEGGSSGGETMAGRGEEVLGNARAVAEKLGYDPSKITISENLKQFTVGGTNYTTAGEAYIKEGGSQPKGSIVLYPGAIRPGSTIPVTVHEIMHQKFEAFQGDLRQQNDALMKEIADRKLVDVMRVDSGVLKDPALIAKYPLYQAYQEITGLGFNQMIKDDGVSSYSRDWWKSWHDPSSGVKTDQAFHETLAEIARMDVASTGQFDVAEHFKEPGQGVKPLSPQWKALYNLVNSNWRKNHWYRG